MSSKRLKNPVLIEQRKLAWVFVAPWIIGFLGFSLYPILSSFYYSFTEYNLFKPGRWIGLQNYNELLHSALFYKALYNTVFYAVFGVGLQLLIGLSTALMLNMKVRGQAIYRTLVFLPSVMPPLATSLLWLWLLNPKYGIINHFLSFLHLPEPLWLVSAAWTKPALILMSLWGVGTTTIIYLASLSDVPEMYYEAMDMDGAGSWDKFRHITLPIISPVTFFQLISGIIAAFSIFTPAFVLTTGQTTVGGPSNSLLFYSVYIYQQGFQFLKFGYASALAWVLLLIVMLITYVVYRTSKSWMHYGGR